MRFQALSVVTILAMATVGAVGQSASPAVYIFGPEQQEFEQTMKDVLFDFDTHETSVDEALLRSNAQWLKDHPRVHFYIGGYTDARGDIGYNLVLAQKRAETVKAALLNLGIPEERMVFTVGWGELYPPCSEENESCWERSRRVHLTYAAGH